MNTNHRSLPVLICDYMATGEGSTFIVKFNRYGKPEDLKKGVDEYFLMGSVILTIDELLSDKYYSAIIKTHLPVFYKIVSGETPFPGNLVVDYTYHANYS